MEIDGKKLFVSKHLSKKERGVSTLPGTNLYVSNFPPTTEDKDLLSLFEPYGKIDSHFVFRNKITSAATHAAIQFST